MAIASGVRAPRAWLSLNGAKILCESASVTLNATRASSRFEADVPMDLLLANGWTIASLASIKEIQGSIYISNDVNSDSSGVQMISGPIDDIYVNFPEQTVSIHGCDVSRNMHNNLNTTQYLNQTSSQIASTIAGKYGLSLFGSSSGMVGKLYTKDFVKLFDGESDWTAIQHLAEIEGYVAYIQGSTIYFQSPGQGGSYSVNYQPPTPGSPASGDFLSIQLHVNLNLGGTVQSTASALEPRQNMNVTATATCSGNGGNTLKYDCRSANMTQDQVQKLARSYVFMSVRHEMEIEAELVGDTSLLAGMSLQISGTQSQFDNSYPIDCVHHEVNGEVGYTMHVQARNMAPGRTIS
jgi:phage protein D